MSQNTPLKNYLFIFAGANLAMMVSLLAVVLTLLGYGRQCRGLIWAY